MRMFMYCFFISPSFLLRRKGGVHYLQGNTALCRETTRTQRGASTSNTAPLTILSNICLLSNGGFRGYVPQEKIRTLLPVLRLFLFFVFCFFLSSSSFLFSSFLFRFFFPFFFFLFSLPFRLTSLGLSACACVCESDHEH